MFLCLRTQVNYAHIITKLLNLLFKNIYDDKSVDRACCSFVDGFNRKRLNNNRKQYM